MVATMTLNGKINNLLQYVPKCIWMGVNK
uniref:Uncharacterized protein n=1 Tax=Arundo donax TaxID=35708 RepID=A0A0A8YU23_ARUDO